MHSRFNLALMLSVAAGVVLASPAVARAQDGAGLFTLPAERTAAAQVVVPPAKFSRDSVPVATLIALVIDVIAPKQSADAKVVPMVMGYSGGGLRLLAPLCDGGCPDSLGLPADYGSSPIRLTSSSATNDRLPQGPRGLEATVEEARRVRGKVPEREERGRPW